MTLREMTGADVGAGVRLCRQSHWNQVARDWEQFLHLTPGGATVAVDEAGEVVGSVATMRYRAADAGSPATLAWLAMVLVDPAHRGTGIGTSLLERGLTRAGDVTTVGLDATPLGRPLYEKLGFRADSTFTRLERHPSEVPQGRRRGAAAVRRTTPADWAGLAALDARATGLERRAMLEWLHAGAPELSLVYDGEDGIEGALLGRHGHHATHVGPVLAASLEVADALLSVALDRHQQPVFIDIADARPGWRECVEALGFRPQRPFTRMYRGTWRPDQDTSRLFAIIGPEFG